MPPTKQPWQLWPAGTAPGPSPGTAVARGLSYAGLAVLGFLAAVAGSLIQSGWHSGGLVLALLGCSALFYGGMVAMRSRLGAVVPVVTWFLTVMYLSASRPEGDFLFAADIGSYLFLLVGLAVGIVCASARSR